MTAEKESHRCPTCAKEIVLLPQQVGQFACPYCGSQNCYSNSTQAKKEAKQEVTFRGISIGRVFIALSVAFCYYLFGTEMLLKIFPHTPWYADTPLELFYIGLNFLLFVLFLKSKKALYIASGLLILLFGYDSFQDDSIFKAFFLSTDLI